MDWALRPAQLTEPSETAGRGLTPPPRRFRFRHVTGEPTAAEIDSNAKAESAVRKRSRPVEPDPGNAGEGNFRVLPLPAFPKTVNKRETSETTARGGADTAGS
jgi:hypothetical protein